MWAGLQITQNSTRPRHGQSFDKGIVERWTIPAVPHCIRTDFKSAPSNRRPSGEDIVDDIDVAAGICSYKEAPGIVLRRIIAEL
jgi:hypothetical protein